LTHTEAVAAFAVSMIVRQRRNVSLTPKLEAFVDERVASGRYRSAGEVGRAALRLLAAEERGQDLPVAADAGTARAGRIRGR
jgi:antitoxin ParD1/3/4